MSHVLLDSIVHSHLLFFGSSLTTFMDATAFVWISVPRFAFLRGVRFWSLSERNEEETRLPLYRPSSFIIIGAGVSEPFWLFHA
eukprot:scaffold3667_cov180-Amphora_coffeaeformis.AAC.7